MKKKIIIASVLVVLLAAWPLSNCMWSGQVVENTTEIPATQKLKSGILETGRNPDISATQMLLSGAAEKDIDAAEDSSRGYIDVDESGDFSEGDILLESSGSNDYFLPQDYYSDTET
jgi:hypothetical protein